MLAALIAQFWPYIAAAAGAVALWVGNNARQRSLGRKQAEIKAKEQQAKAMNNAKEVQDDVNQMDDATVHAGISKWMRDNSE